MPTTTISAVSRGQRRDRSLSAAPVSSHVSRAQCSPPTSAANTTARFGNYTPTTVSSYQRRSSINVEGLPDCKYFTSGQSKIDRRREYISAPMMPSHSAAGRSVAGNELVKYTGTNNRKSVVGSSGLDYDDDTRTLCPGDSISQVSSRTSANGSARKMQRRRDSGYGSSSGASTFSTLSTFQSQRVFDGTRQCYLVERRPRASAWS